MIRFFYGSACTLALCLTFGCGGSAAPEMAAEQDELAAYAAENPAPPETEVDGAGGS